MRRLFFGIFLILFLSVCVYKTVDLKREARELNAEIADLQVQIQGEKKKQLEAVSRAGYYETDDYLESLARSRFNLVHQGEWIIVVNQK